MKINKARKYGTLGIMLLLLVTTITPSIARGQTLGKTIITVDDEPGDADYTSIKEAVQHAQYGDTIEVYSGTYQEHNIDIAKQRLTLQGIPHELGSGNDTGKPVITSTNNVTMLYIWGDDVTIANFTIIDGSPHNLATFPIHIWGDNCTFSYNNVTGGWVALTAGGEGYPPYHYPVGTRIIGNTIEPITVGIDYCGKNGNISFNSFRGCTYEAMDLHDQATSTIMYHNRISNCSTGILYNHGSDSIVSQNTIISTGVGVDLGVDGANNISITLNDFRQCRIGVGLDIKQSTVRVQENNFIGNQRDIRVVQTAASTYRFFQHRIFNGNYYDTWTSGPKRIWGITIIYEIPILWGGGEFFFMFTIWVPWIYRDWHPAQEPYDITEMR
jgi:nitrous oxidase accessory protein NosD